MLFTAIYLVLLLKFSAGSVHENVPSAEFPTCDSEELGKKLTSILGKPIPGQPGKEYCVIDYWRRKYCFNEETITNTTRGLYCVYDNAMKSNGTLNLSHLLSLSQQSGEYQFLDHKIFLKCIPLISDRLSLDDFARFVTILDEQNNLRGHTLSRKFHTILRNIDTDFLITSANFTLTKWHPFESNVTGFALYNNSQNGLYSLERIYNNQSSSDIEMDNLLIAGYIPHDFLEDIKHASSDSENDLSMVMLLTFNGKNYTSFFKVHWDLDNFIGLSIPGYCKRNNLPVLTAFLKYDGTIIGDAWVEFGAQYFDWHECVLDQMTFYGKRSWKKNIYYESVKADYCLPHTHITDGNAVHYRQVPIETYMYPEKFCMDSNLKIATALCYLSGTYDINRRYKDCFKHPTSNITEQLYNSLVECVHGTVCNENLSFNRNLDLCYVDIELYFLIMEHLKKKHSGGWNIQIEQLSDFLVQGLDLIEKQSQSDRQLPYYAELSKHFINIVPAGGNTSKIVGKSNFIYQTLHSSFEDGIVGLVLYKRDGDSFENYEVNTITSENATVDYTSNDTVEVIVYLLHDEFQKSMRKSFWDPPKSFDIIIIHGGRFTNNKNYAYKSRIVEISQSEFSFPSKFAVYLKTVDGPKEGYWSIVETDGPRLQTVYISEYDGITDHATNKVSILSLSRSYELKYAIKDATTTDADIISRLSSSN